MMNLAAALQRNAASKPDKTALICGDLEISYSQFDAIAGKIATSLINSGVKPGDRVALSCPNLPFFAFIYFAVQKAGAVAVPLNVLLKAREIQYHLEDSNAKFFFCFEGTPELPMAREGVKAFKEVDTCKNMIVMTQSQTDLEWGGVPTFNAFIRDVEPLADYVPRNADDTCVVLYTSGTTGLPKGAELTQQNIVMNAIVGQNVMAAQGDDVHLVTLPLFHTFGQTVHLNASVLSGATLVLVPRFEPSHVLELIEKHKVTIFAGVPTMYIGLLHADTNYDISSLRVAASGGSSLPTEVFRAFEEKFNVPILEGYGLSETSPIACFNHLDQERIPGSVGQPIQGVEVKLVDLEGNQVPVGEEGEIIVRGHNVMKGYLDRPEVTESVLKNGWFHTGDVGRFDEVGNLYIVDRIKDLIIRGGFNVYPREIEEVFMTHPAVAMVAVIGIPHQEYGEEIKAYVVLKPDQDIEAADLQVWGREHLAAFKYPRFVEIRDQLPMSATGKILKRELKSELKVA
ncbi:long-chain fatty acid--CoA ligase [Vibrio natriegens]|uniref:long-chain-fatty-acid--CoA ligase n=1 Tax=Vibrio natriegens TaxID=691 RepID=UPI0021E89968|nr:long-chain fatty acid--CoA ligase [Vibrio natriegens]UYI46066.1 long-chain fatty acid--CoA ligase [Vibrio natriegens]